MNCLIHLRFLKYPSKAPSLSLVLDFYLGNIDGMILTINFDTIYQCQILTSFYFVLVSNGELALSCLWRQRCDQKTSSHHFSSVDVAPWKIFLQDLSKGKHSLYWCPADQTQHFICDRLWEIPAKVILFRCQCLCVLLIYITCRIFCAKGITVSQIFCELLHFEFEMLVLENLEKKLYWNTINFNDIRCNFKALLNIFLHFGMDKMYQRGIFTKQNFVFLLFLIILSDDFVQVFP
jgi:hypothetical protein